MLLTELTVKTARTMAARKVSDGAPSQIPVYIARPDGPQERRPGLLLIQEIFGVNEHIQDVANRLAAAGYVVVAPDIFHRSGHWQMYGYDQFDVVRPIVSTLTEELVMSDLEAALDFLAAQSDVDPSRLGVTGYCFGGRMSFLTAARLAGRVKASAIYYGGGIGGGQTSEGWPVSPLDRAGQIKSPVIAFFGALDKHIPREHVERIDAALEAAGVDHQIFYYPYADHGFFCDARPSYNPRAAQDAWHRTLEFFEAHLGPVPAVTWESN